MVKPSPLTQTTLPPAAPQNNFFGKEKTTMKDYQKPELQIVASLPAEYCAVTEVVSEAHGDRTIVNVEDLLG